MRDEAFAYMDPMRSLGTADGRLSPDMLQMHTTILILCGFLFSVSVLYAIIFRISPRSADPDAVEAEFRKAEERRLRRAEEIEASRRTPITAASSVSGSSS
jgi:hypothetical protein